MYGLKITTDRDTRSLKEILDEMNDIAVTLLNYCAGKTLQDDIAEIWRRYKGSEWISVINALPETSDYVLAFLGNEIVIAYYDDEHWTQFDLYEDVRVNPLYWMLLPEPPEVDT